MPDLLVNLYQKDFINDSEIEIIDKEIKIKRLLSPNSDNLIDFIEQNKFSDLWSSEVKSAIYINNPTCFIATKNSEIIGFACYDATAKGYFGPTGVSQLHRKKNVGQLLYLHTLEAMKADGYGYAIIGGAGEKIMNGFYGRYSNCVLLDYDKTLYSRLKNR